MRHTLTLLITLAATPLAAQPRPEQPPSSIPQGPTGTVTVETFLGDLEKGSARQGGGINPRLINMMELVNPDNYPELAFERNVEGTVRVAVKVNNDGLATKCDTIGKPAPELGGPTCAWFLAHGRFVPALDRKQRPVAGEYRRTIVWQLPVMTPVPVAEGFNRATFDFDKNGVMTGCSQEQSDWAKQLAEDNPKCEFATAMVQALVMTSGISDPENWQLRMDTYFRLVDDETWKALGNGPDDRLLARSANRLTVGPDGKLTDCVAGDWESNHPMVVQAGICTMPKRIRFLPSSEPVRKLLVANVVYLRSKRSGKPTT